MYLLTSNTESFDEDVGEVGEDDVEELVDKPRTTNGTLLDIMQSSLLPFLMRYSWSGGMKTHDPHRVSPRKELREFLQEA